MSDTSTMTTAQKAAAALAVACPDHVAASPGVPCPGDWIGSACRARRDLALP